jgi:hypothetical protein
MGSRSQGRRVVGVGLAVAAVWLGATFAGAEGFYPVGGLSTSSDWGASVSLPDGSALVVSQNSIQKYYPAGRAFGLVAYLPVTHGSGLSATLLADGRVLIVGGDVWGASVASAEIYDPVTNTVSPTGSLSVARTHHTATLLADGRVLVAGGGRSSWSGSGLASAEIYDPGAGSFAATGDMASARQNATATRLPDGRVLVAGGYGTDQIAQATAELYDPVSGAFAPAVDMGAGRADHTATALADGSILVTGGHASAPGPSLASAEVYDPAAGVFLPTGTMSSPRGAQTATLLENGRVLVVGGFTEFPYAPTLTSAEIWDPSTGVFTSVAHGMRDARGRHVAAAMPGGEVLVAGGFAQSGSPGWTAEVYSPVFEDTEPPVIYNVQDFTVAANQYDTNGTYVYYYPWATDNVDANPIVTCAPPSGSYVPVGTTTVSCSATDSWGNTASARFGVTVLEALKVTFTIDAFGSVDKKTGVAVVGGTLSCNRAASAGVSGQLTQLVANRATLVGYLSVYGAQCNTAQTAWSSTVTTQNGLFNPGKAGVSASAFASDNYSSAGVGGERTIQLRAKNQ